MSRLTLSKACILRSSKEIDLLFGSGLVYKSASFDVFYLNSEETKVLFAASRKIRPHVAKNRARRRIREMFRRYRLQIDGTIYLAIIAKPAIFDVTFEALCEEFQVFLLREA